MSVPAEVLGARRQGELLFDRSTVVRAIDQLAVRLTVDLADQNPLLLCVMTGGLPFTAALMQRLLFPLEISYLHVSRYREKTSGGELIWHTRPTLAVTGRHVLLVDDILDHGVTLQHLRRWAEEAGAAAVSSAVLVRKQLEDQAEEAEYVALTCPDRYVFGWGMDFRGYWRNLPEIYALPPELETSR